MKRTTKLMLGLVIVTAGAVAAKTAKASAEDSEDISGRGYDER